MTSESLKSLYSRDLNKLKAEIEAYQNEETIWATAKGISNSAGNLCLHLIGNLNAYIGAELGHTDYVRNRDLEFSLKNIPKATLIEQVEATIVMIASSFELLTENELKANYPHEVLGYPMTTEYFLMHLFSHLGYHLGQINYHRRLLATPM